MRNLSLLIAFLMAVGMINSFVLTAQSPIQIPSYFLNSSKITTQKDRELLFQWLNYQNPRTKLLWRGSQDKFNFTSMHESSDNWGSTFILVKTTNNYSFGGYLSKSIDVTKKNYQKDPHAFIFSLTKGTVHYQRNKTNPVFFHDPNYLSFGHAGEGHWDDISIRYSCNQDYWSYSDFGYSFIPPAGIQAGSYEAQTYMAGSYRWMCTDVEIWAVIDA